MIRLYSQTTYIKSAMKNLTSLFLTLLTLLLSNQAAATGCSRDDIDHYLSKGFKHDQITELCKNKPSPETGSNSSAEPSETTKTNPAQTNDDAIFLATALKVYDVLVTDEYIIFKRETCMNFGWEDWNGFSERACPHVSYRIERYQLKIVGQSSGFQFFSAGSISLSGSIYERVLDLDKFKRKHHQQIIAMIKASAAPLEIDIRSGMPANKVETVLRRLAK